MALSSPRFARGVEEQGGGTGTPVICSALGHGKGGWWREQAGGPHEMHKRGLLDGNRKEFPLLVPAVG